MQVIGGHMRSDFLKPLDETVDQQKEDNSK